MSERDYIGVKACGCVVTWASGNLERENTRRDLAKILAEWVRDGLSIERCTTDEARTRVRSCRCDKVKAASNQAQMALGAGEEPR